MFFSWLFEMLSWLSSSSSSFLFMPVVTCDEGVGFLLDSIIWCNREKSQSFNQPNLSKSKPLHCKVSSLTVVHHSVVSVEIFHQRAYELLEEQLTR